MEFKRSVLPQIILAITGIFVSVLSIVLIEVAAKLNGSDSGPVSLAIVELVLFVLMLSALSTKKARFAKVICFISIGILLTAAFVLSIVCSTNFQYSELSFDSVGYLTLTLLLLVSMILFLIYYIASRKESMVKLARITNILSMVFFGLIGILLVVSSFVGIYREQPVYGLELAVLTINCVLMLGLILTLQNVLVAKVEQK